MNGITAVLWTIALVAGFLYLMHLVIVVIRRWF